MIVRLAIAKPGVEEEVIDFDQPTEITIGRSSGNSCVLDFDAMVSRLHAVLLIDPPSVRIKDLNSTNGLVINGVSYGGSGDPTPTEPHELSGGDEVQIGTTIFKIMPVDGATTARASGRLLPADSARSAAFKDAPGPSGEETVRSIDTVFPNIPGYHILRMLGAGKDGTVYLASSGTGGTVALKVITPEHALTRKMVETFLHEIDAARRLVHPHIAKIVDRGVVGGKTLYLAVEYVNGEDLAGFLRRTSDHRMHLRDAYVIMLQLTSALCFAHTNGYVHRDVKPQSIMLYDNNGQLASKLTDIGLTKCLEDAGLTPPGGFSVDSLGYVPPQQITEFRDAKPTMDVFSLAAVFYEMITGAIPYNFNAEDERINVVAAGRIVPIDERMPGLPESLVVIVERCLSHDPDERYRTCCDLLDALGNVRV